MRLYLSRSRCRAQPVRLCPCLGLTGLPGCVLLWNQSRKSLWAPGRLRKVILRDTNIFLWTISGDTSETSTLQLWLTQSRYVYYFILSFDPSSRLQILKISSYDLPRQVHSNTHLSSTPLRPISEHLCPAEIKRLLKIMYIIVNLPQRYSMLKFPRF